LSGCRALSKLPPGHVPLAVRARKLASAVVHGTTVTLQFLVAMPGK